MKHRAKGAALGLAIAVIIAGVSGSAEVEANGDWWLLDSSSWRWVDATTESAYSVAVFGGKGTERNFSDTLTNLFDYSGTSDRLLALSGTRKLAWFRDQLSIEAEATYGYHYGRETYHEIAAAVNARWHDFPWNEYVVTSFAVGVGPSYTSIYPELEVQSSPEKRSKLLSQFNLEVTLALPDYSSTSLMVRLQHRSGIFGALGGVSDASNFLTIGLRQDF